MPHHHLVTTQSREDPRDLAEVRSFFWSSLMVGPPLAPYLYCQMWWLQRFGKEAIKEALARLYSNWASLS